MAFCHSPAQGREVEIEGGTAVHGRIVRQPVDICQVADFATVLQPGTIDEPDGWV
jgi:hypothetical protein